MLGLVWHSYKYKNRENLRYIKEYLWDWKKAPGGILLKRVPGGEFYLAVAACMASAYSLPGAASFLLSGGERDRKFLFIFYTNAGNIMNEHRKIFLNTGKRI